MKKKGFMNRKIHLLNSYGKSFMKLSKYRLYEYKNYLYGNLFIDLAVAMTSSSCSTLWYIARRNCQMSAYKITITTEIILSP
jgi:hypothetical protein